MRCLWRISRGQHSPRLGGNVTCASELERVQKSICSPADSLRVVLVVVLSVGGDWIRPAGGPKDGYGVQEAV